MDVKNEQNNELIDNDEYKIDDSQYGITKKENKEENDNNDEKPKKTTKQKVFFGLKIAGNVLFYALLLFLFLFAIFNINGGNGTDNFPHIFGKGYLSVQSDSMKRAVKEDGTLVGKVEEWDTFEIGGFQKGDLLTDSVFDIDDDANTDCLKIGMVITFYDGNIKSLNTHRIVEVHDAGNGKVDYVKTQGDYEAQFRAYAWAGSKKAEGMTETERNAYNMQLEQSGAIEVVLVSNIRGIVTSVSEGGGAVLDNIRANYLFYFVLPVAALLILEIFFVVRNIMVLRGEKNKAELEGTREALLADVEAEKEKMRQELLAEMRAQGLVAADPNEKTNESNEKDNKSDDVAQATDEENKETE